MRDGSTEEKTFQGHLKNVTSKGGGGPQDAGTSPKRAKGKKLLTNLS